MKGLLQALDLIKQKTTAKKLQVQLRHSNIRNMVQVLYTEEVTLDSPAVSTRLMHSQRRHLELTFSADFLFLWRPGDTV